MIIEIWDKWKGIDKIRGIEGGWEYVHEEKEVGERWKEYVEDLFMTREKLELYIEKERRKWRG